jgi:chromate reductase, NAD(P)H dehydrogenase (quinone)
MPTTPKILAFAGSLRKESYNKKLAQVAATAARAAGAEVTCLDLKDYPLPLFDEDIEKAGTPENATKLKKLFIEHQGFIIASPEYNSSITAVMKNTIDWVSRPAVNEPPLVGFAGKVATLMSASPGALGGIRGLVHLRSILGNIGVIVLPAQHCIHKAFEAFNPDGTLKDATQAAAITAQTKSVVEMVRKLGA